MGFFAQFQLLGPGPEMNIIIAGARSSSKTGSMMDREGNVWSPVQVHTAVQPDKPSFIASLEYYKHRDAGGPRAPFGANLD